jgi:hypothetical protein
MRPGGCITADTCVSRLTTQTRQIRCTKLCRPSRLKLPAAYIGIVLRLEQVSQQDDMQYDEAMASAGLSAVPHLWPLEKSFGCIDPILVTHILPGEVSRF